MVEILATLYKTLNNANPQLDADIRAGDTAIALKSGHGDRLPTVYSGRARRPGMRRNLNDTGDLGSLAVGDYIRMSPMVRGQWSWSLERTQSNDPTGGWIGQHLGERRYVGGKPFRGLLWSI